MNFRIMLALSMGLLLYSSAISAETVVVNGVSIEYEVRGNGTTTVLFEAGALSGMGGWDTVWPHLPDDITAVRYSRRGEGNSGACEGAISAGEYSNDAVQLLKQLEVPFPIVSVSHSYGGDVARSMAALNSGLVAAMLLVDPSSYRDVEIVHSLDPVNGPAEIAEIMASDYAASEGRWCFLDDSWVKEGDLGFADIGDIPVTLISGVRKVDDPQTIFESDLAKRLWGEFHAEWANEFPSGRAVISESSGHDVPNDEPGLVISELNSLLRRLKLDHM